MHLVPALTSGGVEQVVLELCQGLSSAGVTCEVVSSGGRMVPLLEATGASHFTIPLEKKNLRLISSIYQLAGLLRRTRPDILHIHSRIPGWVAFFAEKQLPTRERPIVVSSFHGVYTVGRYSRIMTRGAAVVAVSQFIREHILTHYRNVDPQRIHVIPNSIDSGKFFPGYRPTAAWLETWHTQHPELDGKFVLCLPGRITRLKGHTLLAEIIRGLRAHGVPVHVLIVGETKKGKEHFQRELEVLYERAGVTDAVTWLGHRDDWRDIACVSDVVLSLSLAPESFGKTTLEALALGRPVAGFEHGGVGEQLHRFYPEGCVPVGDIRAMVTLLTAWYPAPPQTVLPVGSPYERTDMINSHLNLYHSLL